MVASRLMAEPTHAVEPLPLHDGKTTVVSVISSSAAVLAACSCCILPMVLVAAGLSASLSSVLAPLGSLHWPMTAFSMIAVAASWLIVLRKYRHVRRQNIWHNSRRRFAECGPRLRFDVRRRACGVASADVRVSFA